MDDPWAPAYEAASSLAPHGTWRRELAARVREAAGAMVTSVLTCPPGFWFRIQHDTVPEKYRPVIDRISSEFVPKIERAGESWRYAIERHGRVYAPLESAETRELADELYREVLAPQGIEGWIVGWFTGPSGVLGLIVVGTARPAAETLPALAAPLEEVSRRASSLLAGSLELAQGCFAVIPELSASELTPRELQIADLATQGYANLNIAARLQISKQTVDVHLRTIYKKLGVHSRAELIAAVARRRP